MLYTLTTPGVHRMELAVLALYDARIGVLVHRAVLKSQYIIPMQTVS